MSRVEEKGGNIEEKGENWSERGGRIEKEDKIRISG